MNESPENLNEPWLTPWPTDGLESVNRCPVCAETGREVLHADMVDNVFRAAPGKWTLWQCAKCRGAYLDPRPARESIHLAYANYYTHREASARANYATLGLFRKLRRRLVNGYTNWRYSTRAMPATALGLPAALMMPPLKKLIDRQYRHLPRLPMGGGILLDVGCGDGAFLSLARACGWDVVGLDPDPEAAANASRQGLTVHQGGIEYFQGQSGLFDVITLNHVIEHVHEPVEVLKACRTLLKPGGRLWLETPNIDGFGHARFQKNWRGLETPRHLVLFNRRSIREALVSAGFPPPQDCARPSACAGTFKASFAMARGHSPYHAFAPPAVLRWQVFKAVCREALFPSRREFLTVAAQKGEP
jgi:2-polyprenyl-3-methyl-5-hydroxy-6-metoxy-1,4-benzoquinol methylase